MTEFEFRPWPKIPRPKGNIITVTEKIDGTNACVVVFKGAVVGCQSRNRIITVGDDNAGFASWVEDNKEELSKLGDGYHYGEWAGPGIQKNPHKLEKKTFFLFNTSRPFYTLPACVEPVKVLYTGPYSEEAINDAYNELWDSAAESKYTPEGLVVYNHTNKSFTKYTYANQEGKWHEK